MSEGLGLSMPPHTWLPGTGSTRPQILSASVPVGFHGLSAASTVSRVEPLGISSKLMSGATVRPAEAPQVAEPSTVTLRSRFSMWATLGASAICTDAVALP